ncbi:MULTISPECIES: biopolymer transporter ExbD [unclassified Pseudoalteromonas]|uniref:biopolymer transporter ExbD n=1 Tax=unclassified Pseudoalteromonas TaxID=194690 RepID=UPI000B3C4EEB|nr:MULTISPECIES: biopolymer transporter ExbD [unclassified Pseudoalteromonas]MDN3379483.1 biopolymer transporter ExbD [Pseudoalteromonas sp. APC 3893]MDN3387823.1 biopolymer transporter ExbD [Pseudoalteromonas sp. APC 4017]OUS69990.1 biopolymer transporter [Pseudoalteromonas sp. A601]
MLELPEKPNSSNLMPDLTALIDVLFILLVFLLLTAAVKLDMLDVTLPEVGSDNQAPLEQQKAIVLSVNYVDRKLIYALAKQPYQSLGDVIEALQQHNEQQRGVYLAIDQQVPSGELVKLLAALSKEDHKIANILIKRE